jgi:hypothetical protein
VLLRHPGELLRANQQRREEERRCGYPWGMVEETVEVSQVVWTSQLYVQG